MAGGFDPKLARHLMPGGNIGGPALQTHGQMGCFIVERHEVPNILWAAQGGDFTSQQMLGGIAGWSEQAFAPRMPRQRCATCDHEFQQASDPEAFFLAIPFRGDGESVIVGVCKPCVRRIGSDGLMAACAEFFKKLWPKGVITGKGMTGATTQ